MEQCPICFSELEIRECAPCDDCGWNAPEELEHLNKQIHTYATYKIYHGLRLTLCNFCAVDFGSYKSEYFGFISGERIDFENFNFFKLLEHPEVAKDKFCSECSRRLSFLKIVAEIRRMNEMRNLEAKS